MSLPILDPILAMAPPTPPGTQADPRGAALYQVGFLVLMGIMLYLLLFRPQQKQRKEQAQMLKSLRPGDKILTTGGVLAIVVSVKEKSLAIRSADSKFEIVKSAVAEVTERSGESSES
jgi:preprotein translocase subunit YajC